MLIRKATIEDKQHIADIISVLHLDIPEFVWSTSDFIEKQIAKGEYFLLENEARLRQGFGVAKAEVVGVMSLRNGKDKIHIETLAVKKEYQNKGFGTALVDYAKQHAKEHGFSILQAYSFAEYQARNFYEKLGFTLLDFTGQYNNHTYHCFETQL